MIVAEFVRDVRRGRFRLGTEALLQEDFEAFLDSRGIPFKREFILGPGERVDFMVDGHCAVELKLRCAPRTIYRQLQRYAAHDAVHNIVLVSARAVSMPDSMNGKPVFVAILGSGYL